MKFKEFVEWCNKRACDGRWGLNTAIWCMDVIRDVRKHPFWKREKVWKNHPMYNIVVEMVLLTNKKITEVYYERRTDG